MTRHIFSYALTVALMATFGPAVAQAPGFAGKTVNLIIGFGPGGGYDLWARTVARHLGKHLPGNPVVTPQNMEGAGSYRAANYMYTVAPKDGTAIALIARDAPLGPLTGGRRARSSTQRNCRGSARLRSRPMFASPTT